MLKPLSLLYIQNTTGNMKHKENNVQHISITHILIVYIFFFKGEGCLWDDLTHWNYYQVASMASSLVQLSLLQSFHISLVFTSILKSSFIQNEFLLTKYIIWISKKCFCASLIIPWFIAMSSVDLHVYKMLKTTEFHYLMKITHEINDKLAITISWPTKYDTRK